MTVGLSANNPGDLQAVGGSLFLGALGTSTPAPGGAQIENFDSLTDGIRALAIDLGNAISSGYNTVSSLVYHYLGTSSNNTQNPNVQGYLTDVEQQTGLSANSTLSKSNVPTLVSAIINAEGNSSGVSQSALSQGLSAAGYGSSSVSGQINLGTILNQEASNLSAGFSALTNDPFGSLSFLTNNAATGTANALSNPQAAAGTLLGNFTNGLSLLGTATSNTASSAASAVASPFAWIQNLVTSFLNASFVTRVVLVLLGVILVTAAVFAFAKPNVSLSDIAKVAPLAA